MFISESKLTKITIFFSILLAIIGTFVFIRGGWINQESSLANIFNISEKAEEKFNQLSILKILPDLVGLKGEKTYLLLFQNNLELRPSGGYLGNFGILKMGNGQPKKLEIHDTNIFDGFSNAAIEPPQPLKTYLKIDNWQLRDSNWSPDFKVSAIKAEKLYHLQGGEEEFDGIIAINASVLPDLLEITGPVRLEEFNKTFESEDILYQLEYEVEKGYAQRGIEPGERKTIFKSLVKKIFNQLTGENLLAKNNFIDFALEKLDNKDILLYFKNENAQDVISKQQWDGQIEKNNQGDYLMLVEANLGGKKSNYFIKREAQYTVDLSQKKPVGRLKIQYTHEGKNKDWFSDNYLFYLRIYTPSGSWLTETSGFKPDLSFSDDLGKKVFGQWMTIPVGQTKEFKFVYHLPKEIKEENYQLLVQKQSGIEELPIKIIIIKPNKEEVIKEIIVSNNWQGEIALE